jgi:uncharacterized protein YjbI with pentapeptide repeats
MIEVPEALGIGKLVRGVIQSPARVPAQRGIARQLFFSCSILLLASLGRAQVPPGVYWNGVREIVPSPAALDNILKAHELWVQTFGQAGTRADLSHYNLSNFNLKGANLSGADLEGAYLAHADLTEALLGFHGLKNTQASNEPGMYLLVAPPVLQVTVTDATGRTISTPPAVPGRTDLRGAEFWDAKLVHADLSGADLSNAVLRRADLSGVDLSGADLTGADFTGARLDGSNLSDSNMDGTLFEPVSVASIIGPESAKNLDRMRYKTNPDALIEIRRRFQDEGLTKQERELTYALNLSQTQLDSGVERWFRRVAFDLTCQYGMSPGRPLRIIAVGWAVFSFLYIVLQHRGRHFRIEVRRIYPSRKRVREFLMWPAPHHVASKSKRVRAWFRFERRTVCAMMFFSLVNAFSLGYREFSVGQWLRMLTKRQYQLRAVGWVRSLAGVQSLASVYLFALWILTYFGRPFE